VSTERSGGLATDAAAVVVGAGPAGLYFVGYEDVSTGLLREIGLQAEAVADAVVGGPPPSLSRERKIRISP
jgi:hypothetical protein